MLDYERYKNANPDKFTVKIPCQCGGSYTHWNKSRHFKQKKHLHFVETGEQFKRQSHAQYKRTYRAKLKNKAVSC